MTRKSVDLTTLAGWEALSSGTHNITIVAKADGYKDSAPSAVVQVEKAGEAYTDCLTFTGENGQNFTLKATHKDWDGVLEYSTDHNTWTTLSAAGVEMSSVNGKLYLRGSGNTCFGKKNYGAKWVLSANASCTGNIQTLLQYDNPPQTCGVRCYFLMFANCVNLTEAPSLPATSVSDSSYYQMFDGCTNLTKAPDLPATSLNKYCYYRMFRNCSNLTKAPDLPAINVAERGYDQMFKGCTNLTDIGLIAAKYLNIGSCYAMFQSCSSLKVGTSGVKKIFVCPNNLPTDSVRDMFISTGGTFNGTPTSGVTYYLE